MVVSLSIFFRVFWSRAERDTGIIHAQFTELTFPVIPRFDIVLYINLRLSPSSWTIDHLVPQEGVQGDLLAATDREPLSEIEVDV